MQLLTVPNFGFGAIGEAWFCIMSSSGSHNFDRNQSATGEPVALAVWPSLRRQGTKHPLVLKDLDPILLREHPPLCQIELYYLGFNDILQKRTLVTELSLWHDIFAKYERSCTTLFRFTPNFSIFELCSYQPSFWAHGRSGCTCMCQQKKKKKENSGAIWLELSSMLQLLFLLLPNPLQAWYNFCFLNNPAMFIQITPPS
jgi:hypothetical protein